MQRSVTQQRPECIFLPGASGRTEFWHPLIDALALTQPIKVISYPGFTDTPACVDIQNFDDLSQHVRQQMMQPAVLIAQSMGGIFAIQHVLQFPHLVKGLVLIATSGGIDLSPFSVQDWREEYQGQYPSYPNWFMSTQINLEEQLYQIQQKSLLIWGDADPISPVAVGSYLQHRLKHAELYIVSQGKHDLAYTHAELLAEPIRRYIAQC